MFEDHLNFFKSDKEDSSIIVFNRPEYNGEETYENKETPCERIMKKQDKTEATMSQPIAAKPFWNDIPDKYKWMAQDKDGALWAYVDKPEVDLCHDCWCNTNNDLDDYNTAMRMSVKEWQQTLERRPE